VRAWALLDRREYVTPADVDRLFLPVLGHRVIFTPTVLAEARRTGWPAAFQRFHDDCLALAPRPELGWEEPEAATSTS
jgi:MoxR-like ATPase